MKTTIKITTQTPDEGNVCIFKSDPFVAKVNVAGNDWTAFDSDPYGFRTQSGLIVPNALLEAQIAAAVWTALRVGFTPARIAFELEGSSVPERTAARVKSVSTWDCAGGAVADANVIETSAGLDSEGQAWGDFVAGILASVRACIAER